MPFGKREQVNMLSCEQALYERPKEQSNRWRDRLLLPLGRYSRSKFGTLRRDVYRVITIFCVLFSGILVTPAFAQGANGLNQTVLRGLVTALQDGKPIEGASVSIDKKHTRANYCQSIYKPEIGSPPNVDIKFQSFRNNIIA